jgi:hypothetical protein
VRFTRFDSDPALLAAALATSYEGGRLVEGIVGSADEWNREVDKLLWAQKTFGIASEDMESASAHQVAQIYGIPFLAVGSSPTPSTTRLSSAASSGPTARDTPSRWLGGLLLLDIAAISQRRREDFHDASNHAVLCLWVALLRSCVSQETGRIEGRVVRADGTSVGGVSVV